MAMKLLVTYENAKTGEYEKYTTTFEELADSFNGMLNEEIVGKALRDTGRAILENGYATTAVEVSESIDLAPTWGEFDCDKGYHKWTQEGPMICVLCEITAAAFR